MASTRICKTHGDMKSACKELHSTTLWCDGQGSNPRGGIKYGMCPACDKMVARRADGTLRAHNGVGR